VSAEGPAAAVERATGIGQALGLAGWTTAGANAAVSDPSGDAKPAVDPPDSEYLRTTLT